MNRWLSLAGVMLGLGMVAWPASSRCEEFVESASSTNDEKTEAVLNSPTTLEFVETPLSEVVEYLQDLHSIKIRLDAKVLSDVGITPDTPVSRNLRGVSLRSGLKLILGELDLVYVVEEGGLLITTPKAAEKCITARRYALDEVLRADITAEGAKARGEALLRFVGAAFSPESWQARGGQGSLAIAPPEAPKFLLVQQSAHVQEEIAEFVHELRSAAKETQTAASLPPGGTIARLSRAARISEALSSNATMEFVETPLSDVIEYVKDLRPIAIQFDMKSLNGVGVSPDTPVTLNLKGVSLRSALRVILGNLDLTHQIDSEVLLITTPESVASHPTTAIFAVADLLGEDASHATKMAADDLLRLIRTTVEPDSWRGAGGKGVLLATRLGERDVLLVKHAEWVHSDIADLLDRLRLLASLKAGDDLPLRGEPLDCTKTRPRIRRALTTTISLEGKNQPFLEVIHSLSQAAQVPIQCDGAVLHNKKITDDTLVSGAWERQPLQDVLTQLLAQWRLVYVIQGDMLWITDAEEQKRLLSVEIYPLGIERADLSEADLNGLAQQIVNAVSPPSWHKAGGVGIIVPVMLGSQRALAIRQTPGVHELIRLWLATHGPW